jgi:ADP-ribosyl-[dinitrogen reductase] hydrolase
MTSPLAQTPSAYPILAGIAAGDALGLPYEGTRPQEVKWGFFGSWGVTSDDTQHALIALRALKESRCDPRRFRSLLAEYIGQWFCCLSPSIGWGTLKSSLKLCAGLEAPQSGAVSEGNGPLPRAAILGWELSGYPQLDEFVDISTTTTHKGTRVKRASIILARTMSQLRANPHSTNEQLLQLWQDLDDSPEWQSLLDQLQAAQNLPALLAATGQGKGISGYAYLTLVVSLWAATHYRSDLRQALIAVVQAGGDTDSAAAIAGGLCAAMGGSIPPAWTKLVDWPVAHEPSLKRVGYNLITIAGIFGYHLPKRMWSGIK